MKTEKPGKGTFYLILIVVLTLLLAADIANYLIPMPEAAQTASDSRPGSRPSSEDGSFAPSSGQRSDADGATPPNREKPDTDSSAPVREKPDADSSAPVREKPDADGFTRPSGEPSDADGFAPSNGGPSEKKASDASAPPSGFSRPDTEAAQENVSTLSNLRSLLKKYVLPVAAGCLIGDLLCLILLLRCRKKQRTPQIEEADEDELPPRRKKSKFGILLLILAAAAAVVLYRLPQPESNVESVTVRQAVLSGTAEPGTILSSLSGTGTLAVEAIESIQIPSVVEIGQYHVHNGDSVSEGTILASVKASSAASAVIELQSVLDELDSDLKTEAAKSTYSTIPSIAGGRVKVIYAAAGDDVGDVVAENGSLMILSLDGLMELQIAAPETAAVGDPVLVTLPDGTTEQGTVVSLWEGTAAVDFPDTRAMPGQIAAVSDPDGNVWGPGTVYIHSQWNVVGYYGTVSSVPVSVNQQVYVGSTLVSVTAPGHSEEYQRLLALRAELEDQMAALITLYADGYIRSTGSGIVSGIPSDAEIVPLAANEGKILAGSLTSDSEMPKLVLLSSVSGNGKPPANDNRQPPDNNPAGSKPEEETKPEEKPKPDQDAEEEHIGLVAKVSGVSGKRLSLRYYLLPVTISGYDQVPTLAELTMTLAGELDYNGEAVLASGEPVPANEIRQGDILFFDLNGTILCAHMSSDMPGTPDMPNMPDTEKPTEPEKDPDKEPEKAPEKEPDKESGRPSGGGMPSGGSFGGGGGFGGTGGQNAKQPAAYESYSTDRKDVAVLLSSECMKLQIQVDELDILSVTPGLEAQITLDAMRGRSFTGTVTKIARTGTNSGGNTKFTVEITLPREPQMLAGMNASASFITSEAKADVTVPVAALVEDGGKTCIYTLYDEKTDTLSGLVPVQTGISDGETVEILSGLAAGDRFFYRYADGISYQFATSL